MDQILFYVFAAQAVVAAVLSVTRKNTVAAACWLVVMFFALAGVFALMEAWFVAAVQILIYAGAIMVLFLFVIMLMDLRSTELASHKGPKLRFVGILLSLVFLGIVIYAIHDAGQRTDVVADRVTAVIRLPAPPPVVSEDPSEPLTILPAPPPRRIPLLRQGEFFTGELDWGGGTRQVVRVPVSNPHAAPQLVPNIAPPEGGELSVGWKSGGLEAHPGGGPDGSARAVGKALFEEWLLPFEIVSLLLTGAIFGTVVLTKRRLA